MQQLFFHENIFGNSFELDPEESRHLIKVLRKSVGDMVNFTDGKGSIFNCRIEKLGVKKTELTILSQSFHPQEDYHVHLAIAPTKSQDRMEWMMEKITEIGFNEITFLNTTNSERNYLKMDRLEKKIISACKQSLKPWKPQINGTREFMDFVADPAFHHFQRFIGYVDPENNSHLINLAEKSSSYTVLIGPEGDFSPQEIQEALHHNFRACSLGNSRLRTETAGLVAVTCLNLLQVKR